MARTKDAPDDSLRVLLDLAQMVGASKALRIDLVDRLGAGRPGCEPAVCGRDLDPAERGAASRRGGQFGLDRLARKFRGLNPVSGDLAQHVPLLRSRRGIDPLVPGLAELSG